MSAARYVNFWGIHGRLSRLQEMSWCELDGGMNLTEVSTTSGTIKICSYLRSCAQLIKNVATVTATRALTSRPPSYRMAKPPPSTHPPLSGTCQRDPCPQAHVTAGRVMSTTLDGARVADYMPGHRVTIFRPGKAELSAETGGRSLHIRKHLSRKINVLDFVSAIILVK